MPDVVDTGTRLVITAALLAYSVGPFVIDLNRTHILHPAWTGHARFHLLWAMISQFAVCLIALWLVWSADHGTRGDCHFAAGIGLALTAGFWVALLFRRAYAGTLSDPGGVPRIAGKYDGNVIAVTVISALFLVSYLRTS